MNLNKRKLELMKLKSKDKSNEVVQRLNIVIMLDAKYKSLVKDGLDEQDAFNDALLKIDKDLNKEYEFVVKSKDEDKLNNINIQREELNSFKTNQLSDAELEEYVNNFLSNTTITHTGKLMGMLSKELKGKADMSKVKELVNKH